MIKGLEHFPFTGPEQRKLIQRMIDAAREGKDITLVKPMPNDPPDQVETLGEFERMCRFVNDTRHYTGNRNGNVQTTG